MMLLLMLIMMLKFCVKKSSNLIDLENFGVAGFFIKAGLGWCPPISQKVTKSLPTPPSLFPTKFYTKNYLKLENKE